jgi:hypothetical protein
VIDRRTKGSVREILTLLFSDVRAPAAKIDREKAQKDAEVSQNNYYSCGATCKDILREKRGTLYNVSFQELLDSLKSGGVRHFHSTLQFMVAHRSSEQIRESCDAFKQISGGDDLGSAIKDQFGHKESQPYIAFSELEHH